jgi:HEAT repeat protein
MPETQFVTQNPMPSDFPQSQYFQQLLALDGTPVILPSSDRPEDLLNLAFDILVSSDFQTRWEVAKLLPLMISATSIPSDMAIAAFLQLLQDEETDEELSWFIIRILGQIPQATTVLIAALKTTESDELKAMIAEVLADQGGPAVTALTQLLSEENWRLLAVRSLSQIRNSATISPLLEVVWDDDPAVRAGAIEALSSFHDARIPPTLLNALNDTAAVVRREAVIGLKLRTDLTEKLNLVQHLKPCLWDFDLEVCCQTANTLGRFGTESAAMALSERLCASQTPLSLQIEVIRALSWINTVTALACLHQRLLLGVSDSQSAQGQVTQEQVIQEIVTGLGRVEAKDLKPKAAQILIEALEPSALTPHSSILDSSVLGSSVLGSSALKQVAALSLGQLGQIQALNALIQLLADADVSVQLHAIAALKTLDPQLTYQHLTMLSDSPGLSAALQQGIAIALAEW